MMKRTSFRSMLVLVLAAAAGACQDVNGPGSLSKLQADAALADYEAMNAVLGSAGWRSFRVAAPRLGAQVFGAATAADVAAGVPLISADHRGDTFVWDARRRDWVVDPERTGAPTNGVRFILYETAGAYPDPSREIGHADLIDEGDNADGVALRLMVVEGDRTIVDYNLTAAGSNGEGHVTVAGFIRNDRDQLDFDIDVRGAKHGSSERGDVSFRLAMDARDFLVEGDLHGEKDHGQERGTVDLFVRHGDRSFRVDVANDHRELSGTIDLDDTLFARVSGSPEHPEFTKPDGQPVTGADALVLLRTYDIAEDVFDLFEDLVEPAAELVILAAIL